MTPDLGEKFWAKVPERPEVGCWVWRAARSPFGYGVFGVGRRAFRAHRLVVDAPKGSVVRHTCDNPSCVRPDHLIIGTYAENIADMWARGRASPPPKRQQAGTQNNSAKLTEDSVRAIRADTRSLSVISKVYGISSGAASMIRNRRRWSHVI